MTRYNEKFNYILFSKAVALSVYPVGSAYAPYTYPYRFVLHPSEDYVFITGFSDGWTSTVNPESGYLAKFYLNDPIVTHEVTLDVFLNGDSTWFYDLEISRRTGRLFASGYHGTAVYGGTADNLVVEYDISL